MKGVQRIRVLILADAPSAYWPGSATLYLQKHLPSAVADHDRDLDLHLYTPHRRRDILRYLFAPMRKTAAGGVTEWTSGVVTLCIQLLLYRFDLLHCLVIRNYMIWPFIIARMARCQTMVTLHDTLFLQRTEPMVTAIIKRTLFHSADLLITMGRSDEERVERSRGKGFHYTVRNGIGAIADSAVPHASPVMVFGGGLGNDHSGLSFLDQVMSGWNDAPALRIFGTNADGRTDERYEGMADREHFHSAIRTARCVVIPSRYESFSMTALESLALGTPVVISDQCGITQYLTDGHDCLIVRFGDTEALRNAILRLMKDDALWMTLSRNGQRTAEAFLWKHVASDHALAYRRAAERRD